MTTLPINLKMRNKEMIPVVQYFGSQQRMVKIFNVTKNAVSQWCNVRVPYRRAVEIEEMTGGQIKAVDLIRGNE